MQLLEMNGSLRVKKKKAVDIRRKKFKNLLALLISTFFLPPPSPLPRKIKNLLAEASEIQTLYCE